MQNRVFRVGTSFDKPKLRQATVEIEGTSSLTAAALRERIVSSQVIHIFGAGLNAERPAHTAVAELSSRGWACAPVHPRDAGGSISGFPIRPSLDSGVLPEIVVLFLAPERARAVVRDLIMRLSHDAFPLIWFQRGAQDAPSIEALESMGAPFVVNDCIVEYTNRNGYHCAQSPLPQSFCLQIASEDGDGCSVWSVHSTKDASLTRPTHALEWVGTLGELECSHHTIPRYIRSLQKDGETLDALALRLSHSQVMM